MTDYLNKMLMGKVIHTIEGLDRDSARIDIFLESGEQIAIQHHQDCCEYVSLEDYIDDIEDYQGAVILDVEERTNENDQQYYQQLHGEEEYYPESYTWTFYNIDTTKGSLWLRWYGTSNGYYSESVSVDVVTNDWRQSWNTIQ